MARTGTMFGLGQAVRRISYAINPPTQEKIDRSYAMYAGCPLRFRKLPPRILVRMESLSGWLQTCTPCVQQSLTTRGYARYRNDPRSASNSKASP